MKTKEVNQKNKYYDKSQTTLILVCWLIYIIAYLGRYSFNANINLIRETFSVSKADVGLIPTMFFISYGAGQIINGLLCKFYSKRYVLSLAIFVSAGLNLAVFLGASFESMKWLWLINGFAQSFLWSSLVLVLSECLDKNALKKAIVVMSTTSTVGTLLTYGFSAVFSMTSNYKLSFILGAGAMMIVGFVWLVFFNSFYKKRQTEELDQLDTKVLPTKNKAKTPSIIVVSLIFLGVFAVANNLVKDGLQTWVPTVLKESFNFSDGISLVMTLVLPILGIFGALSALFFNKFIKDFVSLSCLMFGISSILVLAVLLLLNTNVWILVIIAFGLVTMLMHGVNNVITSIAPLYLRENVNSGMLAGIMDGCCYIGSAISAYGLGGISDIYGGWNAVFIVLLSVCILPVVISPIFFILKKRKAKKF